jgi:DNA-binding response OmpR family regulator
LWTTTFRSRLLIDLLIGEGFEPAHALSGAAALAHLARCRFDLAILDAGTDKIDGLELLRRLRVQWHLPVLMLTASGGEEVGIMGLELGGDDYLVKPFRARELVARLRAILRRSEPKTSTKAGPLTLGELALDFAAKWATMDGVPVRLTTAEFLLLESLALSVGRVQSRATLTHHALGRRLWSRSIAASIRIRSFRGHGYVLTVLQRGAKGGSPR